MTIIDEYLALQEKYEKKFGENTIVLMEVGGFFELYGIVNNTEKRGKIYEISDITNLSVSKKSSRNDGVSHKNPLMAGFPSHSFEKWKNILLKHNYTIVKVEQEKHETKKPTRKVTEIISPGINISATNYSNHVMSIYLEEFADSKTLKTILQLGISVIDITTGKSYTYETHSKPDDYNFSLDEIFRLICTYNPCEILIHTLHTKIDREKIIEYLQINDQQIHFNIYSDSHLLKNSFKTELLNKIYRERGMLTAEEYIHLERSPFALASFVYLIQFVYDHNENIINKLSSPEILNTEDYLVLSHDSISQLNVMPNSYIRKHSKISSLWDVIDKTKTVMGRRLLRSNLLNPIINAEILNKRYDNVENMIDNENFLNVRNILGNIVDIERLHRRMAVKLLDPYGFLSLDLAYKNITLLVESIVKCKNINLTAIIPDEHIIKDFNAFIQIYNTELNIDNLAGIRLHNIHKNIFQKGIYEDIDILEEKIIHYKKMIDLIREQLSESIVQQQLEDTLQKTYKGKESKSQRAKSVYERISKTKHKLISIKYNDKEGHYLFISNSKSVFLKKALAKQTTIDIAHPNNLGLKTNESIIANTIVLKSNNTGSKITIQTIKRISQILTSLETRMMNLSLDKFKELMNTYYTQYKSTLNKLVEFVSYIDFISNIAHISIYNSYTRPIITVDEQSYINVKGMRHPIIEKINTQLKYIPNDLHLGINAQNGILLYGVNAVGKSSLMKSVGLNIILAQTGFFVPADEFIFSPFKHIFTRISNNDNIFKGQSTFAVEMAELRSILKRANQHSLVLGDELCCGTETTSGLSIVTAGVLRLSSNKVNFIFATHLHKLSKMEEIVQCDGVNNYHMETIFNKELNTLVYNRKLKPGSGNAIYGLEVAKAMELDKDFIEMAEKIRKKIMNKDSYVVRKKTSSYNTGLVITACEICKNPTEEVHHINEQQFANKFGMIGNINKNNMANLVQLCHDCHNSVHNGNLNIYGYISTTSGIKLDYNYKNTAIKTRKKKYNDAQIEIIRHIYQQSQKYTSTKRILHTNHNICISHNTIKSIILHNY
tara:strand:+ start:5954 stop:9133 length:3180 start_codon:yes stop_codon:yes gene_type:complete